MKYAEVILSISHQNIDHIFSYIIPEEIENDIKIGMRVIVPFGKGNKSYEGYVINFSDDVKIDKSKLKSITTIIDKYPLFSENMIELAKWMRIKYYSTLTDCLKCIMPTVVTVKTDSYLYINYENENIDKLVEECLKKDNQQSKVLSFLKENESITLNNIKIALGITSYPIKALVKKNIIKMSSFEIKKDIYNIDSFAKTKPFKLNYEQQNAFEFIKEKIFSKSKKPILIHGVTGSGKTEIYMQIIDEVIKKGKQAIILVPEISLTPQTVNNFIGRFGNLVTVTHSRLSNGERFDQWIKAKNGEISIMIGPRSAIFTPFNNLGIIIIDEEHEGTYKSELKPKYDAREIAFKISEYTDCSVVLGSATPSIETYYYTKENKIDLIKIKNRVNNKFPDVNVVDMRQELINGNRSIFSKSLLNAIYENIEIKKQTILFLNRRGHSTFVSCRKCGYVMQCDNCNVNYTYHIDIDKLICHYCGTSIKSPSICPQCGSKYIKYFGVGTQKIENEINKVFPDISVLRMDMDTTSKKNSHENILKKFAEGKADILIGTQMIAKGLDFPNVSLVGVIAADLSLNSGDYKCAERTFQLLNQVSGRAGRADITGKVFIQTYNPEHYSIKLAKENNYEKFYETEITIREQMLYPPFSNIFFVMMTGTEERKIITMMYRLLEIMKLYNRKGNFELLGPAPALISKVKNQYRWKIIVKCTDEEKIRNYVLYCLNKLKEKENLTNVNLNITLNPNFIL